MNLVYWTVYNVLTISDTATLKKYSVQTCYYFRARHTLIVCLLVLCWPQHEYLTFFVHTYVTK